MQRKISGGHWILLAGFILMVAVLACGPLGGSSISIDPTPTPTATPQVQESIGTGGGETGGGESTEEPADQPEATEPPDEPPIGSSDPGCLVGTWQTVPGTVESYMQAVFDKPSAASGATFNVTEVEGYLTMSFDDSGNMTGDADEYKVNVAIPELNASIDVVVVLSGSAQYTADESTISVTDPNYQGSSLGDGVVEGIQTGAQEVVVNITPGAFSAQSGLFSIQEEGDSGGDGHYECSGDTLLTAFSEYGPVEWMRVH